MFLCQEWLLLGSVFVLFKEVIELFPLIFFIKSVIYWNCFYRKLKHISLDDASKYAATVTDVSVNNQVTSIPLTNGNGDNLILEVSLLED